MGTLANPPTRPDGRQTQPSSDECDFPEYIIGIKRGSASAPNTQLSLDDDFYRLMHPWLVKRGNALQTVSASHLTLTAHDARSSPGSESYALITGCFFRYIQSICEADLEQWAQK